MRDDLPSGTVTFLFSDVEGSTKLLHELGAEGYAEALAEHRRMIREACARHDGVEVDTQGDAFFFAFPTASGAIEAAGEMTESLASGLIQVRIGLHTGTPLLTEEGYVGDDVHFGARVAAASHGGQVVVSSATAELIEIELVDLGEHRLKDIEGAVSIFQLGDGSFPPLKTISNTNLPRPASSFVGRERELEELLARIEAGARLVTLTGPGGSGKTRLALEAAASLVPEYKAGVFWVGLAALRDPALVVETISQTIGAKDSLAEHIGDREMLLLLDNLEQVIDAAPELSSLLSTCPNLTLLVTSRELLRVQGEVEYPVPPLAEPEAVALFCERAQIEPSEEIAELCARLDNLPLAVELAAARAKALSPAQILERLSQRLDLLKGGRDADPRQQTLRATIEWSYELLSQAEQQLFARLSVFAGGCTLEAAEEVADADLDTLQSLVEKSLLRFTKERYWMLETIREYAGERFGEGEADERDSLTRGHAEYFTTLSRTAGSTLRGSRRGASMARLESEIANVRDALSLMEVGEDGDPIAQLVAPIHRFWGHTGRHDEEGAWLGAALAKGIRDPLLRASVGRCLSDLDYRKGRYQAALARGDQHLLVARELGDREELFDGLTCVANAACALGNHARAGALYDECLALARDAQDPWLTAFSLGNLVDHALMQGLYAEAEALSEESISRARGADDESIEAVTLLNAAIAGVHLEHFDLARLRAMESIQLGRRTQHRPVVELGLEVIAAVDARSGLRLRAAELMGAASALRAESGTALEPSEQVLHAQTRALLSVEDDGIREAWERGSGMTLDDAVDHALVSID